MGFSKRRFDKEYESKLEMFKFAVHGSTEKLHIQLLKLFCCLYLCYLFN